MNDCCINTHKVIDALLKEGRNLQTHLGMTHNWIKSVRIIIKSSNQKSSQIHNAVLYLNTCVKPDM